MAVELDFILKIVVASLLGGLIGFERQSVKKSAGLRTHMLLALASCVLIIVSIDLALTDITRVIQGIVTGMGFIGAGTILLSADKIKGVTTAASLWTVTIIGIIVGFGSYSIAIVTSFIALLILWLGWFEHKKARRSF